MKSVVILAILALATPTHAELDAELQGVLDRARQLVGQGRTAAAEDLVERMTRVRRHDPRTWMVVGNLRVKLGALEDARNSYMQAARLGTEAFRSRLRTRMKAAKIEPFPDRVWHGDWTDFQILAAHQECWDRRYQYSHPTKSCPLDDAPFTDGGLGCPNHAGRGAPPAGDHRVTKEVLERAAGDPTPWMRRWAVEMAAAGDLAGPALRPFMAEQDSAVRGALLARLWSRHGSLASDTMARRLLLGFSWDEDFKVRAQAWTLMHLEGRTPELSEPDLHQLVMEADKGRASQSLAWEVVRKDPDAALPVLVEVLEGPKFGGRVLALMLLFRLCGREGALAAARAFRETSNMALTEQFGLVRHLITQVEQERKLELGKTPADWVAGLERAEDW